MISPFKQIKRGNKKYIVLSKEVKKLMSESVDSESEQELDKDIDAKDYSITVLSMAKIYIPTSDLVDKEEVLKKLEASKAKLEAEIQRSEKMLSNESFLSKAPEAKINAEKTKYAEYKAQYDEVIKALKDLK